MEVARRYKKVKGAANWFQRMKPEEDEGQIRLENQPQVKRKTASQKVNQQQFSNIMFIPLTHESQLKKRLQGLEDELRFENKIKFVEKTGPTLSNKLVNKDPWKAPCGRSECVVCEHSPGICTKKGVVYRWTCLTCKSQGQETYYYGETSRTLFERMSEHLIQIKAGNNNSPMVEHQQEEHEGIPSSFKLEFIKSTPKPLDRQIWEGQLIRNP